MLFLLLPCLLAFMAGDNKSQYTIPEGAATICAADMDLDGDMDIITGHHYDWQTHWSGVSILKNNGHGTFEIMDSIFIYGGQMNIYACKINNDNNPDIISQYQNNGNNINILFYPYDSLNSMHFLMGNGINFFTNGDINGDNFIDFAFTSNNNQYWGLIYNDSNGNFSSPEYHYVTGYYPQEIACGDLNGDNRDDVAIGGPLIEVFYSTDTGFRKEVLSNGHQILHIVDFDRDGDNDLLTATGLIGNVTSLIMYENINDTSLKELPEYYFSPASSHFLVQDFNNDSLQDLAFLSIDNAGGIYILYNEGNFQFSDTQYIPLSDYGEGWRNFCSADLDGNGYNDFAIVRTLYIPLAGNLELLFNDGNGHFVSEPQTINKKDIYNANNDLFCYPDPFRTQAIFSFEIWQNAFVELIIYNLQGELIKEIINQPVQKGKHTIIWNSNNKAGVYMACLKINGKIMQTKKIMKY